MRIWKYNIHRKSIEGRKEGLSLDLLQTDLEVSQMKRSAPHLKIGNAVAEEDGRSRFVNCRIGSACILLAANQLLSWPRQKPEHLYLDHFCNLYDLHFAQPCTGISNKPMPRFQVSPVSFSRAPETWRRREGGTIIHEWCFSYIHSGAQRTNTPTKGNYLRSLTLVASYILNT